MLLGVDIPHEPFYRLVRAGTAGDEIGKILDSLKPPRVYFERRLPVEDRDEPDELGNAGLGELGKRWA
jgi:hypothetical protein